MMLVPPIDPIITKLVYDKCHKIQEVWNEERRRQDHSPGIERDNVRCNALTYSSMPTKAIIALAARRKRSRSNSANIGASTGSGKPRFNPFTRRYQYRMIMMHNARRWQIAVSGLPSRDVWSVFTSHQVKVTRLLLVWDFHTQQEVTMMCVSQIVTHI